MTSFLLYTVILYFRVPVRINRNLSRYPKFVCKFLCRAYIGALAQVVVAIYQEMIFDIKRPTTIYAIYCTDRTFSTIRWNFYSVLYTRMSRPTYMCETCEEHFTRKQCASIPPNQISQSQPIMNTRNEKGTFLSISQETTLKIRELKKQYIDIVSFLILI